MVLRFLIYGMIGWSIEILYTGVEAFFKKDICLTGKTYLWMFPLYGSVVFLEPLFWLLRGQNPLIRGGVYMCCIFAAEYLSGTVIRRITGVCPWDYGGGRLSVEGLIRWDFAPCWFAVGLLYEAVFFQFTL